jgi:hypothetical protein
VNHSLILVDLRKKSVISSDVAQITQLVMELSPKDRTTVLKLVRKVVKEKTRRRIKSVRRAR